MSPDDLVRLQHMLDAIDAASKFIEGRNRGDLDTDQMLVFSSVRAVEIIGEAASRVSPAGRAELPEVPWSAITGMRNRLVHAYFDVDLDVLWKTLTQALPELRGQLLPKLGANEPG